MKKLLLTICALVLLMAPSSLETRGGGGGHGGGHGGGFHGGGRGGWGHRGWGGRGWGGGYGWGGWGWGGPYFYPWNPLWYLY